MFNRISPNHLTTRLDADFYKPDFILNEAYLKKLGQQYYPSLLTLKTLVMEFYLHQMNIVMMEFH
ncbi:hypothetical protein [Escherichia coli]|uniref:hypothetical protein n=1 Tax=Escherichia coli TaxID=562 RepID=UPI000BEA2B7D|nr:hypothetical protein [Escherichia coli]EFC5425775.1 hypothetical protein [Escherichia coli]MCJ1097916.1 hypothetical protein [Escherichia coli]MCJ1201852.1 hypothetical protein [Escherichia coli]MCW9759225.1 hypothetical protein [Escherichia coli]HBE6722184.1 hypothetical protein [Escherichia coli]